MKEVEQIMTENENAGSDAESEYSRESSAFIRIMSAIISIKHLHQVVNLEFTTISLIEPLIEEARET